MPESTPKAAENVTVPKRVCEKCRNEYTLDHFQQSIQGQDCVCKRCLRVMGYRVK